MEEKLNSDIAKELIIVLSYFDEDLVSRIPNNFLKYINDLAADSTKEFYIDKERKLSEQNISEDCKDLIGLIYYLYFTNSKEKDEILDMWTENYIGEK